MPFFCAFFQLMNQDPLDPNLMVHGPCSSFYLLSTNSFLVCDNASFLPRTPFPACLALSFRLFFSIDFKGKREENIDITYHFLLIFSQLVFKGENDMEYH